EDGVMIEHKAGIVGPLFQRLDTPAAGIGDVALALPVLAVVDKAGIFKQVARLLGSSSQQVCSLPWVLRSVGVALGRGAQEATDDTWLLRDRPLAGHDDWRGIVRDTGVQEREDGELRTGVLGLYALDCHTHPR